MRNMTSGSIYRHLLAYAIPLIFGNFLQLTYNAVDSILVSKGAGVAALSAVSVSNPVSVLLVQSIYLLGHSHGAKFGGNVTADLTGKDKTHDTG